MTAVAITERPRTTEELMEIVVGVGGDLELAPAEQVIEWAVETFGPRFCVTSSMADSVLAHLASTVAPGVDVVFLDTGYHFAETLGTRDAVEATLPVNLRTVTPRQTVAEQDEDLGPELWRTNPDLCCHLRKVEPLNDTLSQYDAWATGLRRADSRSRAATPILAWDSRREKVKLSPLAHWSDQAIIRYVDTHGVLLNPLLSDGYPSIGCQPCTRRVAPGEDIRSGRWAGSAKTECGIHG